MRSAVQNVVFERDHDSEYLRDDEMIISNGDNYPPVLTGSIAVRKRGVRRGKNGDEDERLHVDGPDIHRPPRLACVRRYLS